MEKTFAEVIEDLSSSTEVTFIDADSPKPCMIFPFVPQKGYAFSVEIFYKLIYKGLIRLAPTQNFPQCYVVKDEDVRCVVIPLLIGIIRRENP